MAKEVKINVKVDTKDGKKTIKDLNDEFEAAKKTIIDLEKKQQLYNEELAKVEEGSDKFNFLQKKIADVGEEIKSAKKDIGGFDEGLGDIDKTSKKSLKGVSTGFKGVGLAIKATGLGLLIGLFQTLKTILESQQPVLDLVETTFTAISLAISAVTDVLGDVFEAQSEANGGFDATKEVLTSLLSIALTPTRLAFLGIKAAVIGAQLIWEKSFLGNNDPTKIKELETSLSEVKDEVIDLGQSVVDNVVNIGENIGEAVGEVTNFVEAAAEGISKIDGKAIISAAQRATELKKQAAIAEAVNKGILETYDRLAEGQRQLRDDDTKSISDRIEANNELGKILEKQESLMLANAQASVRSAQADLAANDTTENRVALINAQNEVEAVRATIAGLRSEQLSNEIALQHELEELERSAHQASLERDIEARKFDAERIEDDLERLRVQREILADEKKLETERLQSIIDSTEEGTQARVDAEQELLDKLEEIRQEEIDLEDKTNEIIEEKEKKSNENKLAEQEAFNEKVKQHELQAAQELADAKAELLAEAAAAGQEILARRLETQQEEINTAYESEKTALKDKLDSDQMTQAEYDLAVSQLEGKKAREEIMLRRKAFNQQKALGLVEVAINTAKAISAAQASAAMNPLNATTFGAAGAAQLAAMLPPIIATGAIQAGVIASQKFKAARGGVVPGAPSMTDSVDALLAPGEMVINSRSASMFPQQLSAINQAGGGISLAPEPLPTPRTGTQVFNDDREQPMIKTYVVESDMSDKQRRVSRIENSASFG